MARPKKNRIENGEFRNRIFGFGAFRTMLTIARVAYDLAAPFKLGPLCRAIALKELCVRWCIEQGIGRETASDDEERVFRKYRQNLAAALQNKIPGGSSVSSWMRGEVSFSEDSLGRIMALSPPAYFFHEDPLWSLSDESAYNDYAKALMSFSSLCRESSDDRSRIFNGHFSINHRKPPISLIAGASQRDNLETIRFFYLLHGAAKECGWDDLKKIAIACLVRKLARLTVVPPYSSIRPAFAGLLLKKIEPDDHWVKELKERTAIAEEVSLWAIKNLGLRTTEGEFGGRFVDRDHLRAALVAFEFFQTEIDAVAPHCLRDLDTRTVGRFKSLALESIDNFPCLYWKGHIL